ncbi:hypothetical protein PF008_g11332 [Phytophthora fragariae]|uniref:Uncharacterized protein n=1 Tax=Phytophthora fragariae TaxID=53985 RepID=A0A6G0RSK2_9STRA|nr:hypothetical protein PF008_g11332 [Phytophthora fragariae]
MQRSVSDDPAENSKQALKALKCVAFSSKQMGTMLDRRRERLPCRLKAVVTEMELLRAHIGENVLSRPPALAPAAGASAPSS